MNKEWVKQKQKLYLKRAEEKEGKIKDFITDCKDLNQDIFLFFVSCVKKKPVAYGAAFIDALHKEINQMHDMLLKEKLSDLHIEEFVSDLQVSEVLKKYQDGKPVCFSGDIILMDPIHLITHIEKKYGYESDKCGYDLKQFGIHTYTMFETICGDYSYGIYQDESGDSCEEFKKKVLEESVINDALYEPIGYFFAESGLAMVADYSQVSACVPEICELAEKENGYAYIIRNFKGAVQYAIKESTSIDSEGDDYHDYEAEIIISGINKNTGENINCLGTTWFD